MIITTNKYKTIATSTYLKKIKKRIWPIKDRQGVMENIGPVHFSEINISKTQQIPLIQPSLSPTQYSPLLASFSFSSFFCLSVHPWLRLHFHVSLSCISSNNWCAYRRNHLPLIMGFNNYIYLPLFFSFLLYLGFQVICRRGYERHWYPCWLDYLSWFPQNPWGDSDFTNPTNSTSTLVSPMGFTGAFFFFQPNIRYGFLLFQTHSSWYPCFVNQTGPYYVSRHFDKSVLLFSFSLSPLLFSEMPSWIIWKQPLLVFTNQD